MMETPIQVFKMSFDELDRLHQETDCSYFRHDEEIGKVHVKALGGNYCFGVDKFVSRFPNVDISGINIEDYKEPEMLE